MNVITDNDLIELGFIKEFGESFHYYVYEVGNNGLLISCANDEKINGGYSVEFYEHGDLKFFELDHLKKQIEIINKLNKL